MTCSYCKGRGCAFCRNPWNSTPMLQAMVQRLDMNSLDINCIHSAVSFQAIDSVICPFIDPDIYWDINFDVFVSVDSVVHSSVNSSVCLGVCSAVHSACDHGAMNR